MFDLDAHIRQWRQQFLGDGAFYSSEVEELECHLRDAIDELYAKGLSEEEAFVIAVHRLGDQRALRKDYTRGRSLPQRLFRSRPVAAAALVVVLMLAVLVPLGAQALADLVSESGTWLIRAREGAAMYVESDGLYVQEGNAGLINPAPVLAMAGIAFGVVTSLAVLGWGLIWQAGSSVRAS